MAHALVIGGASWNTMVYLATLPQPVPQTLFSSGYHETVGMTGAGKALNLRRLGLDVTLHAMLGDDEYGRRVRDYLAQAGVALLADSDPAGTPRHVNLMSAEGERISIFLNAGTFALAFDSARLRPLIQSADYIVLNIMNYARTLIPAIREQGKAIWCDLHDYDGQNPYHEDFVQAADYLFLSSDALPDYRAFMERQIVAGKELVVCTHGRRGATALSRAHGWAEQPIAPGYTVVDTNGAGDAFMAGFLYGHARGWELRRCLRVAAVVAGLSVTSRELAHEGLSPELVAREERRVYEGVGPAD